MHPTLRRLAASGLFLVAALSAAAFEGRVSLGFSGKKNQEQLIDYAIKGTRVRLEPKLAEAGGAAMIMDLEKREMVMLMTAQRMYMTMPLPAVPTQGQAATAHEQKLEKTGRTEKILGYDCEEYVVTEGGQSTHLWLTDQLGSFMGLSGGGNPMAGMMGGRPSKGDKASGWESLLKSKGGAFPLRVVTTDKAGKESFKLEAKKIEPGTLPDALFAPPADFQKFAMPAIPGLGG